MGVGDTKTLIGYNQNHFNFLHSEEVGIESG